MINKLVLAGVLAATAMSAQAETKKELVQKILAQQQPVIEGTANAIVQQPVIRMMQAAGQALQQMPADKRDAAAKRIDADAKKFVDEASPVLRERALKLAPTTFGAALEEKFSEAELKELLAWFESPVNKKYQQVAPELQNGFVQQLQTEAGNLLDAKLKALQKRVATTLGVPTQAGSAPAPAPAAAPKK